jgi:plastocyanin domain-containing protein
MRECVRTKALLVAICAALVVAASSPAGATGQARRGRRHKIVAAKVQTASVALTERGYEPASFKLRRGVPARVTFVRKVSAGCGTEIMLPEYGVRRPLPLDEPVVVEFTPQRSGEFTFSCGMGMLRGTVIVK